MIRNGEFHPDNVADDQVFAACTEAVWAINGLLNEMDPEDLESLNIYLEPITATVDQEFVPRYTEGPLDSNIFPTRKILTLPQNKVVMASFKHDVLNRVDLEYLQQYLDGFSAGLRIYIEANSSQCMWLAKSVTDVVKKFSQVSCTKDHYIGKSRARMVISITDYQQ